MEQEITDFDPFEPVIILECDGSEYIDSEPMDVYDWMDWLEHSEK
jgi:hypothetical protein